MPGSALSFLGLILAFLAYSLIRDWEKGKTFKLILGKGDQLFLHVFPPAGKGNPEQCLGSLFPDSGLRLLETRLMRSIHNFPGTGPIRMVGALVEGKLGLQWVAVFSVYEKENEVILTIEPAKSGWHERKVRPSPIASKHSVSFPLPIRNEVFVSSSCTALVA